MRRLKYAKNKLAEVEENKLASQLDSVNVLGNACGILTAYF